MPVINRIAGYAQDMRDWRHWLHRNPELGFDLPKTSGFVAERLREFGIDEIHEGIAKTGLVALVNGQGDGPTIGLRADMDALPILEESGVDYGSETPGHMHACGHDGHTVMLLGAAKYLAETRNFSGRVALIFQPAEEDGGGGGAMVDEGIMERFDIARVFALHNAPNSDSGSFYTDPGAIMAAVDEFEVKVRGQGGHAAYPQEAVDPIPPMLAIIEGFSAISSRNHDPVLPLVISTTQIRAGTANNVIPAEVQFSGTVRSFDPSTQAMVEERMQAVVKGMSAAYGVHASLAYHRYYPATVNHAEEAAFAADVAREIVGPDAVNDKSGPEMGAEDFAYMLQARPGAYLFLGQGDGPMCHHPSYDFNDDIAPIGASFFARIVERAQPLG